MSCFYCGKRVSLVRKRNDPDFCCDDHREKYNARTRRSMEVLAQDEERMVVTKRLTEGFPLPPNTPCHGAELDDLVQRNPGKSLPFIYMPTGLPVSRAHVATFVPAATRFSFRTTERRGDAPQPLVEPANWSFGRLQEAPRPPEPFMVVIVPPEAGILRVDVRQAACDQPRILRLGPGAGLGGLVQAVRVPHFDLRAAANSMGTLLEVARPPDPVKPPPASPPIMVTLRNPSMAVSMGRLRKQTISTHMPQPGMVGMSAGPSGAAQRPPDPAYVRIVRTRLEIQSVRVLAPGMLHAREARGEQRTVPCPEGFRRKQYYSWELPERYLGMGFQTIAGHRPEMRIMAAPDRVPHLDVQRAWVTPQNDRETALPENRRPAPPFHERLELPGAIAIHREIHLLNAGDMTAALAGLDVIERLPQSWTWQNFDAVPMVQHQGGFSGILPAQWAAGTAESLAVAAWAKPQAGPAKRTTSHVGHTTRSAVFAGPRFLKGLCQAGPTPALHQPPPRFEPRQAQMRSERVESRRKASLPATPAFATGLRPSEILPEGCQAPIGHGAADAQVHHGLRIVLAAKLPTDHLRPAVANGLRIHRPAKQTGAGFDIAKGSPVLLGRETLDRYRKRGYEALRNGQAGPCWPTQRTPGLLLPKANTPCPHPSRDPDSEIAEPMFRACDRPAAAAFERLCALMDSGTAALSMPGSADWGRESHAAHVPLRVPPVLPIDPHGPIRDWGLAPPPEPEKPPEPINEDFAAGLANWVCPNADWRQDIAGVRTGSLALLRPSLAMQDYELEFLGKIENRSISWVFRASNTSNYHAAQIALDGAEEGARLVHYSVLAGDREEPVTELLSVAVARNASCRVKVSVSGNDFKVFLNDQPAGEWSDDRLPEGGIGFFSEPDDRARLYWVKVTPYYEEPADDIYARIPPIRSETHRQIRIGV